MRKVIADTGNDPDKTEDGQVHYEGVGMVSTQTLCGHVDRVEWTFNFTNKRVNCPGCIAVRDHVLGR